MPMPIPRLLYHNTCPQLYPEGSSTDNVLAIRFPSPIRVQSIRLIPEGVGTINGGLGNTYPTNFQARLLLNTSPSEPVNALSGNVIDYDGRDGWERDYEIGMPEGVGTRLMILSGAFERISLSVYGYPTLAEGDQEEAVVVDVQEGVKQKQDWGWVSDWAGGVTGLMDLLDENVPDESVRQRALACLDLLVEADSDSDVLDQIITHLTALSYLLLLPSYPPQPILQRLYASPKHALAPEVRHHLPPKHPYRTLSVGSDDDRRKAAWRAVPDPGALWVLREVGAGEWDVEVTDGQSRLARLVRGLQDWPGHDEGYELGLDLLLSSSTEWEEVDTRARYLARRLPALIVSSRLRGSNRTLDIPFELRHEVLDALLDVPPLIDGLATARTVSDLAQPYLPLEPFTSLFGPEPDTRSESTGIVGITPDERAVARLSASLDRPDRAHAYIHDLTPAQILSAIAPDLLASLSTARDPPFGIQPAAPPLNSLGTATASASAFAGKVYSSHEFRTREGTSTAVHPGATSGVQPVVAAGLAPGVGGGGGGLGVGTLRASRPASRHVDEYAR